MKKLLALIIALITVLLLFVSCGEQVADTTDASTIASIEATAETTTVTEAATTSATVATRETAGTELTAEETTSTTETSESIATIDINDITVVGEYTDVNIAPFEKFATYVGKYKLSADMPYMMHSAGYTYDPDMKPEQFLLFIVAGHTGDEEPTIEGPSYSFYYCYATEATKDYFSDRVYKFRLYGTPSVPRYGVPRLKIGKMYFRLASGNEVGELTLRADKFIFCGTYAEVVEIDGELWIYPNAYISFEKYNSAVPITDEYEKLMYKPGEDDDIIAYMNENNIPIPKYEYKIKLEDYVRETCAAHRIKY